VLPILLVVAGVGIAVWIGARSVSNKPPGGSETMVALLFASVLQVVGGSAFSRIGNVDKNHARSAVRRLVRVGVAITNARVRLETVDPETPPIASAKAMLFEAQFAVGDGIADWNDVHEAALREVLAEGGVE